MKIENAALGLKSERHTISFRAKSYTDSNSGMLPWQDYAKPTAPGSLLRTNRRRILGEKVAWTAGRVVGIRNSARRRTGGACLAVIGPSQCRFFSGSEMVFSKTVIFSWTARRPFARAVLAFTILTRAVLTRAILARAILASAVLTRAVLARAVVTGPMGIRTVEVCEEEPVDDRTSARHSNHYDQQQNSVSTFHSKVSQGVRPTSSQMIRRAQRHIGMHREAPRSHPQHCYRTQGLERLRKPCR